MQCLSGVGIAKIIHCIFGKILYNEHIVRVLAKKPSLQAVLITITLVLGLFLSVVFHELFHLALHRGAHLEWFPSFGVIAEVNVNLPSNYNLADEEAAAYGITTLVLLITAMAISDIYDATDKRTTSQILLPKHLRDRQITSVELAKIAETL